MIYNLPRAKKDYSGTWVINESCDLGYDAVINADIAFRSNSISFPSIQIQGTMLPGSGIYYGTTRVCAESLQWTDTKYRTITFAEAPTGDLLAWLKDNAVKSDTDEPDFSSCSVSDVSGASYKFELNSTRYYESNNKGVHDSAAVCRVNIHAAKTCTVTFKCINYAEADYDFGLLGTLDKALDTGYLDTSTNVAKSFKGLSKPNVQTYAYTNVAAGDHFIDVKYRKNGGRSSYNDSLRFTVEIS